MRRAGVHRSMVGRAHRAHLQDLAPRVPKFATLGAFSWPGGWEGRGGVVLGARGCSGGCGRWWRSEGVEKRGLRGQVWAFSVGASRSVPAAMGLVTSLSMGVKTQVEGSVEKPRDPSEGARPRLLADRNAHEVACLHEGTGAMHTEALDDVAELPIYWEISERRVCCFGWGRVAARAIEVLRTEELRHAHLSADLSLLRCVARMRLPDVVALHPAQQELVEKVAKLECQRKPRKEVANQSVRDYAPRWVPA